MAWPGKMGLGHNQASADILRWILHQLTVDLPSVSACSTFSSSWISLKKKTIITIIINRLSKVIVYNIHLYSALLFSKGRYWTSQSGFLTI